MSLDSAAGMGVKSHLFGLFAAGMGVKSPLFGLFAAGMGGEKQTVVRLFAPETEESKMKE